MWLVKAEFRLILPVAVLRKRLAAPLLVFIFGIFLISSGNRLSYPKTGPESTLRFLVSSVFLLFTLGDQNHGQGSAFLLGVLLDNAEIFHGLRNTFQ